MEELKELRREIDRLSVKFRELAFDLQYLMIFVEEIYPDTKEDTAGIKKPFIDRPDKGKMARYHKALGDDGMELYKDLCLIQLTAKEIYDDLEAFNGMKAEIKRKMPKKTLYI